MIHIHAVSKVNGVIITNSSFGKGSMFASRDEAGYRWKVMEGALGKPPMAEAEQNWDSSPG